MTCTLYLRVAAPLLRQKIRCTPKLEIYFGSFTIDRPFHPKNTEVGVSACQTVEQQVKSSARLDSV